MRSQIFYAILALVLLVSFSYSPIFAGDLPVSSDSSQAISFYHPTGINGFIVYDINPDQSQSGLSYERKSFDLSSPLGLPVTVEVEGLSISDGSYDLQKILKDSGSGSNYLDIFSIRHALAYGSKSSLSPLYPGRTDIIMVMASANYKATDRFSAKLSTGFSQAVKEKSGSDATLGYELDIAGLYEIAPGLTFSVGAGYATNADYFSDLSQPQEEKRSWTLNSKLRLRF